MKKTFSLVLAVIMLFGIVNVSVSAASTSDLTFKLNSDGQSYSVTDCKESASGSLVVPSKYSGKPVTKIGDDVFSNCILLTAITIPDSVIDIGSRAFYKCERLTTVVLSKNVTTMGMFAFAGCEKLSSITIPESVLTIGRGAFSYCLSLESIIIPGKVKYIADFAFEYCPKLSGITIPLSVISVGQGAFADCSGLKNVYYSGSSADRNKITIAQANDTLLNATWHYAKTSKPATPKTSTTNAIGGVQISWNKVNGAVKYNVYRRGQGQTNFTYIGTTTGNTYLDKNVKSGQYYCYTVRAFNADGGYSAYVKANTSTRKYVATPKLAKLVNSTNGLTLSWDSVMSGASYRVYRRGAGQTVWTYLGTTNKTTYTDSKATSGNYWRYTVRAVSSGYYSSFENGIYTMRLANPYSIKATQVQDGVKITWAKINGATGYRVYRRGERQTSWTYLGATTGNTFKDTKVSCGQYYRYTVRATRGNVYSWFSSDGYVILYGTPITKYLPVNMEMRYGAGVTFTDIKINSDGTFSGEYRSTMRDAGQGYVGTTKTCTFTGKFKNIKQVSANEYTMKLEYIKTSKPAGQVWIKNNHRYMTTEAHGFENGDVFKFYTTKTLKSSVPSNAMVWYNNVYRNNTSSTLGCYMLYNVNGGFAFVS